MSTPSKRCAPVRILLPLCDDASQCSIHFVLKIIFDLPIGFPINNIISLCRFHVGLTVELIHPTHLSPLNLCVKSPCIYVLHSRLPKLNAVPRNVSSPATVLHSSADVSARAIFTVFTLYVHHSSVSY